MLCTDGFWELIDEKAMVDLLKRSENPDQWINSMQEIIEKNGEGTDMDNYSAIGVFVERD